MPDNPANEPGAVFGATLARIAKGYADLGDPNVRLEGVDIEVKSENLTVEKGGF